MEKNKKIDENTFLNKYESQDTTKSINQTGTEITFLPDQEIFGDLSYDYKKITERFREMTYLNQGLCIMFKSELHKELWPNNI